MSSVIDTYIQQIKVKTQDLSGALKDDGDYRSAIGEALEQYSIDSPPNNPNTALHVITETTSTVKPTDFYAFCKLAAAELLQNLADKYTGSGEGAFLNASFASFTTKGGEFERRAKTLRQQYFDHMASVDAPRGAHHAVGYAGASPDELDSRLHPQTGRRPKIIYPTRSTTWREDGK